jgi:hypothetical protein
MQKLQKWKPDKKPPTTKTGKIHNTPLQAVQRLAIPTSSVASFASEPWYGYFNPGRYVQMADKESLRYQLIALAGHRSNQAINKNVVAIGMRQDKVFVQHFSGICLKIRKLIKLSRPVFCRVFQFCFFMSILLSEFILFII